MLQIINSPPALVTDTGTGALSVLAQSASEQTETRGGPPDPTWVSRRQVSRAAVLRIFHKRSNVSRTVLNGEREFIGEVAAGDIAGFKGESDRASTKKASPGFGYDPASIGRTGRRVVAGVRSRSVGKMNQ